MSDTVNMSAVSRPYVQDDGLKDILCNIKAVAFDLDGTLCDSIGNIIACTRALFARLDLRAPQDAEITATIGMRLEEGLRTLLPPPLKKDYEEVTLLYRRIFSEHPEFMLDRIFPGVEELLEALKARGIKIGFISGRIRKGVMRTLDATFLGDYADLIVSGDEGASKPAPDLMRLFSDRSHIPCASILGVGDSDLDVGMCLAAGSYCLAVQTGVCNAEDFLALEAKPQFLLPSAADLQGYL